MKDRLGLIAMYLCLLAAFTCGICELTFSEKDGKVSETENRMLQAFPEMTVENALSGRLMSEFESFLSDWFFFREEAVNFTDRVLGVFSLPETGPATGEIDEDRLAQKTEEDEEILPEPTEPDDLAEEPPEDAVSETQPAEDVGSAELWLVNEAGNREVIRTYSPEVLQNLARIINAYRAELPEDGSLSFVCAPVSAIANNIINGDYTDWGSSVDDVLQPLVNEGVRIYDATDILRPYLHEAVLYPTVDHHWHPISASLVAKEMLQDQGVVPNDYWEYQYYLSHIKDSGPFDRRTLESMEYSVERIPVMEPVSPVSSYVLKRLTEVYPSVFIDRTSGAYREYLGGTMWPWRLFETGFHTGRNALVIGDSFSNCFIPYLVPFYDQIISTDFRDISYTTVEAGANAASYIEKYGAVDIYIVHCTYTDLDSDTLQNRMDRYLHLDYT